VLPQSAFNVSEAEEPHPSFVENAIAKARHAARATGLPALADDSGLCVDVLGGAPGVLSARFAGEPKSDPATTPCCSNAWPASPTAAPASTARWPSSATPTTRSPSSPAANGTARSSKPPRGQGGFGYDPLFLVPDLEQTAAEIDHELKNVLSHRGNAFRQLLDKPARRSPDAPHGRSPHHPHRPPRRRPAGSGRVGSSPPRRPCRSTCTSRGACEVPLLRLQLPRRA
jgi:XTP/dITP diphosphohydrolase